MGGWVVLLDLKSSQLNTMSESESAIQWHTSLEEYFASTGEKAHCLSWCHKKAEVLFATRRTLIDLPVIVISAVTGFLSAGSTTLFNDPQASSVALGVASLFVSVLNTAGSYFGWAKRAEGHRISAIHYSKLYRSLQVELGLPREERMPPASLLKHVRDQYDRLQEISPLLPPEVIREFQAKFKNETEVSKPEELNGLEKVTVFHGDDFVVLNPMNKTPSYTNARTPNQGIRVRREEGVQDLFEPSPAVPQTRGGGTSSPTGGRIAEGGQGGGHQVLPPNGDGHAEGDSNAGH